MNTGVQRFWRRVQRSWRCVRGLRRYVHKSRTRRPQVAEICTKVAEMCTRVVEMCTQVAEICTQQKNSPRARVYKSLKFWGYGRSSSLSLSANSVPNRVFPVIKRTLFLKKIDIFCSHFTPDKNTKKWFQKNI